MTPAPPTGPDAHPPTVVRGEPTHGSAAPSPGRLPAKIGPYEIEAELGRGGMGVVYRARDERLRRLVALKVLPAGSGSMEAQRFVREARSAARLEHPGIVHVYETGEADGRPWFSMEYVPGTTLDRVLRDPEKFGYRRTAHGGLEARAAADVVRRVAEAVEHAHAHGIVHRDLKPGNVLVREGDRAVKVADFGLAKDVTLDSDDRSARLTQVGMVFGTPGYMPPEQATGKVHQIGPRSDVYALGAVLFELLTGRVPFEGNTMAEILIRVISDEPPPPRQLDPSIPRDLETVCLKALEKRPEDRYPSAAALARDLQLFLAGNPVSARPLGAVERAARTLRRHRVPAAVAGAVVGLVLAGAFVIREFRIERDHARAEGQRWADDAEEARRAADAARIAAEGQARRLADAARIAAEAAHTSGADPAAASTSPAEPEALRALLERRIVTTEDPALVDLPEALRSLVVARIEALHARLVETLGALAGTLLSLRVEVDAEGRRAETVWKGAVVETDARRLLLRPGGGPDVIVPWVGIARAEYWTLAARHAVANKPARDRFDLGALALWAGRVAEARRELSEAAGDSEWKDPAERLLARLPEDPAEVAARAAEAEVRRRQEEEAERIAAERRKAELWAEEKRVEAAARLESAITEIEEDLRARHFDEAKHLLAAFLEGEGAGLSAEDRAEICGPVEALAKWWGVLCARLDALQDEPISWARTKGAEERGKLRSFDRKRIEAWIEPVEGPGGRMSVALLDLAPGVVPAISTQPGAERERAALCWALVLAWMGKAEAAAHEAASAGQPARAAFAFWGRRAGLLVEHEGSWAVRGEAEAKPPTSKPAAETRAGRISDARLRFVKKNDQGFEEYEHKETLIRLVLLPPGEFEMGAPADEPARQSGEARHRVKLTRYHLIGKYEVTNAQFRKFRRDHDSGTAGTARPESLRGDDQPALRVTWDDADAFCRKYGLRLPTEAEWEYAARGGDGRVFPWGEKWPPPNGCGNYGDTTATQAGIGWGQESTYADGIAASATVGRFPPNPFGLHDVGGNAVEWCSDWCWNYSGADEVDPQGPATGDRKVLRGGSYFVMNPQYMRCAGRYSQRPDLAPDNPRVDVTQIVGFRVAMDANSR